MRTHLNSAGCQPPILSAPAFFAKLRPHQALLTFVPPADLLPIPQQLTSLSLRYLLSGGKPGCTQTIAVFGKPRVSCKSNVWLEAPAFMAAVDSFLQGNPGVRKQSRFLMTASRSLELQCLGGSARLYGRR